MTTLFWALEYAKILIAYGIIFFLWPSIVLRKFLKGKTFTFQFCFCLCFQIVLINTVVLMLGLVHLLHGWIIALLFYGPIVYKIAAWFYENREENMKAFRRIVSGTYGIRRFFLDLFSALKKSIKNGWTRFRMMLRGHLFEGVLLVVVLIFGVIYFSYGAFHAYSFGSGDMYSHTAWIQGLLDGKIFSSGVYPEGMHCVLYAINVIFGIRVYSIMLFFQGIHSFVFLVAAYLFFREVFQWRYTPLLTIAIFLILDSKCVIAVFGMARLQWTIAQEFSLFATFLTAAFFIRFIKQGPPVDLEEPKSKFLKKHMWIYRFLQDENLLMFSLSIAAALVAHVYPLLMAIFLCVACVPVMAVKVFKPKTFLALMGAAVLGVMVAIIPMAGALASGIPFQSSIDWAVNVINGTDAESNNEVYSDDDDDMTTEESSPSSITFSVGNVEDGEGYSVAIAVPEKPKKITLETRLKGFYYGGYETLYGAKRGHFLFLMVVFSTGLFVVLRVARSLRKLITRKKEMNAGIYDHYFSVILASVIFMVLFAAGSMGLPNLIAAARIYTSGHMLTLGACLIPLDALFGIVEKKANVRIQGILGTAFLIGIYAGAKALGAFHGYLYYEFSRHNAAAVTTLSITDTLPRYSYTIVSPVDELYQVMDYGYHEEAVLFVNECIESEYTLPTEYVFIYVEKNAVSYAQSHFFSGPSWLADEKYMEYYEENASQEPDIVSVPISPGLAQPPFFVYPISTVSYAQLATRVVLEARLMNWCEEFEKLYPNELHVYYEDDDFVCYYFRQNPACLYQLGFQMEGEREE